MVDWESRENEKLLNQQTIQIPIFIRQQWTLVGPGYKMERADPIVLSPHTVIELQRFQEKSKGISTTVEIEDGITLTLDEVSSLFNNEDWHIEGGLYIEPDVEGYSTPSETVWFKNTGFVASSLVESIQSGLGNECGFQFDPVLNQDLKESKETIPDCWTFIPE